MKKIATVQSNYIPWKGYFDLIAAVDEFILYDDAQYTRRDWRNRNKIKTPDGLAWLTVPVKVKGKYTQLIRETEIDGSAWAEKHWRSLAHHYTHAPCFQEIASWLKPLYFETSYTHLSTLNRAFIEHVCAYLGIRTVISNSWDYRLAGDKTQRLVDLCLQAGAAEYISGPAAKGYLGERELAEANIKLTWFDYDGYPEYPQVWGDFTHYVTILDLLFNCGRDSGKKMRYVR